MVRDSAYNIGSLMILARTASALTIILSPHAFSIVAPVAGHNDNIKVVSA